jgi:hypothetical protein
MAQGRKIAVVTFELPSAEKLNTSDIAARRLGSWQRDRRFRSIGHGTARTTDRRSRATVRCCQNNTCVPGKDEILSVEPAHFIPGAAEFGCISAHVSCHRASPSRTSCTLDRTERTFRRSDAVRASLITSPSTYHRSFTVINNNGWEIAHREPVSHDKHSRIVA